MLNKWKKTMRSNDFYNYEVVLENGDMYYNKLHKSEKFV